MRRASAPQAPATRLHTDAAQAHPDSRVARAGPAVAQRALRGPIHVNTARDTGQAQIAPPVRDPLITRVPARRAGRARRGPREPAAAQLNRPAPGRVLLELCRDREHDVLRFIADNSVASASNRCICCGDIRTGCAAIAREQN